MTLEDKARNSAETVRGKAKDVVGRATGDKDRRPKARPNRWSVTSSGRAKR